MALSLCGAVGPGASGVTPELGDDVIEGAGAAVCVGSDGDCRWLFGVGDGIGDEGAGSGNNLVESEEGWSRCV